MPHTPSSDRATTRKPLTAPPRIATWTASTRLRRAADAVRTFERTLIVMPMIPESIEQNGADEERDAGEHADRDAREARHVRDLGALDPRDDGADDHRRDEGE